MKHTYNITANGTSYPFRVKGNDGIHFSISGTFDSAAVTVQMETIAAPSTYTALLSTGTAGVHSAAADDILDVREGDLIRFSTASAGGSANVTVTLSGQVEPIRGLQTP